MPDPTLMSLVEVEDEVVQALIDGSENPDFTTMDILGLMHERLGKLMLLFDDRLGRIESELFKDRVAPKRPEDRPTAPNPSRG